MPEFHGLTRTPTNIIWQSMRARCNRKNHEYYYNYGGRGIKVCKRWDRFTNFLKDMGERPKDMSIERKNRNRGYSPGNCKWATRTEQNRNSSQNRMFTYKGKRQCLSAWCEELKKKYHTVYMRIQHGWTIKEAFET